MSGNESAGASILVVEDDEQIAEIMRDFLEAEGFQVRHAGSGRETRDQLECGRPDLVLLDVMLPDDSGFEICRRLRRHSTVPVLFLSARDSDADKIRGLGLGGDDYIVKSATPAEVIARVQAVLRRAAPAGGLPTLRFGELEIDLAAHEVSCEGRQIGLTARESDPRMPSDCGRARNPGPRAYAGIAWIVSSPSTKAATIPTAIMATKAPR